MSEEVKKLKLKSVRTSLGLTQKMLAREAELSEATIIDVERKNNQTRLITAYAILDVLNPKLIQRGRPTLTIDSLDWNVESA